MSIYYSAIDNLPEEDYPFGTLLKFIYKATDAALDISGKSYMSWVFDAEIHIDAMSLADTIKDKNQASNQDSSKAMIFLFYHLDEGLKMKYITLKDPIIMWNNWKDRYVHLKMIQQCREMRFKKYSELISHLLVAKQHNVLLMKTHESRPTGSYSFPEVNETNLHQAKRERGRGPSHGHGRGRGRNYNHGNNNAPKNPPHHQQCKRKEQKHEAVQATNAENACYRCG
ncbi:uncharacterized protein [Nicotiana tomentosiformis]|uniref:uncharacterized protein n=1 Tax=Nicotiana tomentosiformis TaxID=4098 RepID=UPI00388C3466